jgi:hypothetical protein
MVYLSQVNTPSCQRANAPGVGKHGQGDRALVLQKNESQFLSSAAEVTHCQTGNSKTEMGGGDNKWSQRVKKNR